MQAKRAENDLISIAAVDDHKLFLAGLDHLLNCAENGMVCTCFSSGLDLLEALEAGQRFDVIVTDLTMKDLNGLALISAVRAHGVDTECIMLSASEESISRASCERLGAFCFLHKSEDAETLLTAIRRACAAKAPAIRKTPKPDPEASEYEDYAIVPALGPRQIRVLELISEGLSNKEISETLFISENTVKTHLKAIFRELGVKSRTAAALRGRELSLI